MENRFETFTVLIAKINRYIHKIKTKDLNKIDAKVRKLGLENEQWFLDWQDELNKISVR